VSLVPTLDVAAALSSEPGALKHLAAGIGAAARGAGFFRVTGHGLSAGAIASVFAMASAFFALPAADKERISIARSQHNRGYVGLRVEALDPKAGKDHKEAFNIGLDLPADDPEVVARSPFRGVNLWPADPAFRAAMLAYYDFAWRLGCFLHRAIALDLGLPENHFDSRLDRPMAILRLLRYPPPVGTGHVGAGEHTDYGNLTLLLTDEAGGLEVRTRDGQWLAVAHEPGSFIVNIGDCLMRWTNDVYVSTPHRVTHVRPRERLSIAFFLDPNPDALVDCLPGCLAQGAMPRYPAITAAHYLKARLDATYA
jgi:isopenicillin N synthase-like dioxygenase